jgi:hypothetical protein
MLKQGYDHFEVTRLEPKVDVCDKRYVFNAETNGRFSPTDHCPAYRVPADIAAAVHNKERRDEMQTADLINRGTPVAPSRAGVDGGMNPTFLSAVKLHGGPGAVIHTASGTIPAHVNPPTEPSDTTGGIVGLMGLASAESRPAPTPGPSVQVASASSTGSGGGFFSNLFGSKKAEEQPAEVRVGQPKPKTVAAKPTHVAAGAIRSKAEAAPAESKTAAKPHAEASAASPAAKPDGASGMLSGAAPTVPSGGFDTRFGSWH